MFFYDFHSMLTSRTQNKLQHYDGNDDGLPASKRLTK